MFMNYLKRGMTFEYYPLKRKMKKIDLRNAFDIYYSSKLAEQISNGSYGIENMDAKYLAEDLVENEPELFK